MTTSLAKKKTRLIGGLWVGRSRMVSVKKLVVDWSTAKEFAVRESGVRLPPGAASSPSLSRAFFEAAAAAASSVMLLSAAGGAAAVS